MTPTHFSADKLQPAATASNRAQSSCLVCGSSDLQAFFRLPGVPVHCNRLWPDSDSARRAPRGEIDLVLCRRCGHIFNQRFEPDRVEYDGVYENSLHYSPRFRDYAQEIAAKLVNQRAIHNKAVLEIGCGQGEFLSLLCDLGQNTGLGFDPSYIPASPTRLSPRVTIRPDIFQPHQLAQPVDLIICRHVLEHLPAPADLLRQVRASLEPGRLPVRLFFETPNVRYTLKDLGIWDLIYEHVSYFSPVSLAALFQICGYEVEEIQETYGGQFITLEALPAWGKPAAAKPSPASLDELSGLASEFGRHFQTKLADWNAQIEVMAAQGQTAAVWGAGSKGVTFLNLVQAQSARPNPIVSVIDLNPRKHGLAVPGTGHIISPPAALQDRPPDVVLVMNPLYLQEIQAAVRQLGLAPRYLQV